MKKLFFTLLLVLVSMTISAQSYEKNADGKLVPIAVVINTSNDVKTEMIITKSDVDYSVYKTPRGKYYIVRLSGKSGNEYKQYIKIEG